MLFRSNFLSGGYRLGAPPIEAIEAAGMTPQRVELRALERHQGLLGTLVEIMALLSP